jgi:hypothetical protein
LCNHRVDAEEEMPRGLVENLPGVLILYGDGGVIQGFTQAHGRTSRGRLRRLEAMCMAELALPQDRTCSPVKQGVVPLEPRQSQNNGCMKRLNEYGLHGLTVIP